MMGAEENRQDYTIAMTPGEYRQITHELNRLRNVNRVDNPAERAYELGELADDAGWAFEQVLAMFLPNAQRPWQLDRRLMGEMLLNLLGQQKVHVATSDGLRWRPVMDAEFRAPNDPPPGAGPLAFDG